MPEEPLFLDQFEEIIVSSEENKYLKALYHALEAPIEDRDVLRCQFRENNYFLDAIKNALNSEQEEELLDDHFEFPPWFLDLTVDLPPDCDWYQKYRKRFLKAHTYIAHIGRSADHIKKPGLSDLVRKTEFPPGLVLDLFHLLKRGKVVQHEELADRTRKVPVLLAREGAQGTAAYLFVEQVKFDRQITSEPYPHPAEMFSICVDPSFEETVSRAFNYVSEFLLRSGKHFQEKDIPIFRWWVEMTSREEQQETQIEALEGHSFYGAFIVGMLCSALNWKVSQKLAITCNGDKNGWLDEIGELAQKCDAAAQEGWKVIIAQEQDTKQPNNAPKKHHRSLLLRTDHIQNAIELFKSEKGLEVIDYLELVHERWGQLQLTEVSQNTQPDGKVEKIDFDDITKPMTVCYIKGLSKNTEEVYDWDDRFSNQPEKLKRGVIYGWAKVGKTRLLRHEARKISKENVDHLKKGKLNLEQVTIPIFIQCADLGNQLKGETTFEEALFATLKAEYQINGQILSEDFVKLIKDKFASGHCVLLLDDFHRDKNRDKKKVWQKWVEQLNQFARNYPKCRIIITVQQEAKNKKDDYDDLPLEITAQSDEAILELLSPLSNDCPYKGLQFFDVKDAKYFYGRKKLTLKLIEKVKDNNFLAVLGNSGSGKSSVVRAGLLHQLKLGEILPESQNWKILSPITPAWQNQKPLENLAQAFVQPELSAVDSAIDLQKAYQLMADTGAEGLKRLIATINASRVVLVIDQFEEIFTRCDKTERQTFFDCLLGALTHDKLCLVIVIRADFHGKWADYAELSRQIDDHSVTVTKMAPDELEQAITEPANKVALGIEQDLVRRILKDMHNSPSNLPLLQFALERLWHQKKVNWLTLAEYDKIGGIEGALKNHADKVYQSLSPEEQDAAQWIFQGVTQLGEGVEDTRKQIAKQDLITPKYPEALIERTLDKLIKARLLVSSVPPLKKQIDS